MSGRPQPPQTLHPRLLDGLRVRSIAVFAAVVEAGGIGRAAALLSVAQPSVSRSIRELERLVGAKLFAKAGRRIVLTEPGRMLYVHSRHLLADVRAAATDLESGAGQGHVRVGILVSAATQLLPRAVMRSKQNDPDVTIAIYEMPGDALVAALSAGELDLVVGRMFEQDRKAGFTYDVLYDEPIVLCGRRAHPIFARSGRRAPAIDEVCRYPWILPPTNAALRREIDAAIKTANVRRPNQIVESMAFLSNRTLLAQTDMLAFLPQQLVAEDVTLGVLDTRPLPFAINDGPVGITFRADRDLSAPARAFVACVREAAAALPVALRR